MRTTQIPAFLIIAATTASASLTGICRAAEPGDTAPPPVEPIQQPGGLAPVTPTRSTPVSASQTSAIPANGPQTDTSLPGFANWSKPVWLSDLSLGIKESYDDNVLRVAGLGLPTESSWVDVLSLKLGFNLASIVADPGSSRPSRLYTSPTGQPTARPGMRTSRRIA